MVRNYLKSKSKKAPSTFLYQGQSEAIMIKQVANRSLTTNLIIDDYRKKSRDYAE